MKAMSPCFDCPNRAPGCHDPEKCQPWAEYFAACQKLRDARTDYAKTWTYESGRDRNRTMMLKHKQRIRSSNRS